MKVLSTGIPMIIMVIVYVHVGKHNTNEIRFKLTVLPLPFLTSIFALNTVRIIFCVLSLM